MIERISHYDPAENICWRFGNPGDRANWWEHHRGCPACSGKACILAFFGRCRSGKRWFWSAHIFQIRDEEIAQESGFVDTEDEAWEAATNAVRSFRDGSPIVADVSHDSASRHLKELNKQKRAARPPSASRDARMVEYLYATRSFYDDMEGRTCRVFKRFRIVRKTRERVFYVRDGGEEIDRLGEPIDYGNIRSTSSDDGTIANVDRQKLEAKGEVDNRGVHWSAMDHTLFLTFEGLLNSLFQYQAKPPDLKQLKAAMAAAHPDKGGSSAAFIAARAAFEAARREMRKVG
jgi:hypothetical protein